MKHTLALIALFAAQVSAATPLVEPLKPQDEVQGCGCSFHVPVGARDMGQAVMQWELGEPARMRVDGKLELLLVGSGGDDLMNYKTAQVGQPRTVNLRGERMSILASCVVAEICSGSEGACEVVSYRARLSITTPSGSKQVEAWVSCGC